MLLGTIKSKAGKGEMGKGGQRYNHTVLRGLRSGAVMYSMVNAVNSIVLYIWKLLREQILKDFATHTKR